MRKDEKFEEILSRLRRYCAYRERCSHEVRTKMAKWELSADEKERMLRQLKSDNFVDDGRYAVTYARSKNRQNKWGKKRIAMELRSRDIEEDLVTEALAGIDREEYDTRLKELVMKKRKELGTPFDFDKKQKLLRYISGKGYAAPEIFAMLEELKIDS